MRLQAKDCREPQKPGEGPGMDFPSEPPEETNHAHTLVSDFWPPEPWENKFLLF